MSRNPASLHAQRRLLRSLGFTFLEQGADFALPEARPEARGARRPAAPPARKAPPKTPLSRSPQVKLPPTPPAAKREEALGRLRAAVLACEKCPLHYSRNHAIPGGGPLDADLLIISETPSAEDDATGLPHQGELGDLLDNMLKAMKLSRERVYLTHAAKCRPMGDRPPTLEEIQACRPYLAAQVELVRPRVVLSLGYAGLESLLPDTRGGLARHRGRWKEYRGLPLMATFALGYIIRNRDRKKVVWEDLQVVMKKLGAS